MNIIDLSHNNSPFDWKKLNPSIVGIIDKGTESNNFKDPVFLENLQKVRDLDLYFGEYLFWHPQVSPQQQADLYFSRGLDFTHTKTLSPIIDVEQTAADSWVQRNQAQAQANLRELVTLMKAGSKRPTCTIYTDKGFWTPALGNPNFSDCNLWIAAYQPNPPKMFAGWTDYALWQFSDRGSHIAPNDGGDIDWSVVNPNFDIANL